MTGVLVRDRFDGKTSATTLGRAETGETWTPRVGTWGCDSSGYAYNVSGTAGGIATVPCQVANGDLWLKLPVIDTSAGNAGLVYRYQDGSNYWRFFANASTNEYLYQAVVAGSVTLSQAYAGRAAGDEVHVNLNGNTHTFYRNGTLLGSVTDNFLATLTTHGLWSQSSVFRADDFRFVTAAGRHGVSY